MSTPKVQGPIPWDAIGYITENRKSAMLVRKKIKQAVELESTVAPR